MERPRKRKRTPPPERGLNLTPEQAKDFVERTTQSFAEVMAHKDVYPRAELDIPTIDGLSYRVNL